MLYKKQSVEGVFVFVNTPLMWTKNLKYEFLVFMLSITSLFKNKLIANNFWLTNFIHHF